MVENRYVLEQASSGRDIDMDIPWLASFRPGVKVNMSMMLFEELIVPGRCPRCYILGSVQGNAPEDANAKW